MTFLPPKETCRWMIFIINPLAWIKYIIFIKVKAINLFACIVVMQIPSFTTKLLACQCFQQRRVWFFSVSQNSLNVSLDLLYHNFAIRCTGSRNAKWLSSFKQALSIYLAGGYLFWGYNAELNHVLDWCVYQRNNKQHLEIEKQYLLGVIGIWYKRLYCFRNENI